MFDPSLIKQITKNHQYYSKKPLLINISKSLVETEDKEWKRFRTMFAHAFVFENLKNTVPLVKSVTE